eukprot:gb/GECG01000580.1/.p1 GENE.gb/GECG01000580.1/~~gb/GECG01000580.1/.p1  ORF type:complete len:130 (+),score=13.31 gb/GECG01000580.1/:1-390(+)
MASSTDTQVSSEPRRKPPYDYPPPRKQDVPLEDLRALRRVCSASGSVEEIRKTVQRLGSKDINGIDLNGLQWTPLHWAACSGRVDLVQVLLREFNGRQDVKTADGETPLELAQYLNHKEVVDYLEGLDH